MASGMAKRVNSSTYIKLLSACIRAGDLSLVDEVVHAAPGWNVEVLPEIFAIEVRNAYRNALVDRNLDVLSELGNPDKWHLGRPYDQLLQAEAVLNLRELVQDAGDPDLIKLVFPLLERILKEDAGNPVSLVDDSPAIAVGSVIYMYGSSIFATSDSSVKLVEMKDPEGRLAILETVPLSTLAHKGFDTVASWRGYLATQVRTGVTFKTTSVEYKGVVHTVYDIPEGFHSLGSARSRLKTGSEYSILEIAKRIGEKVEASSWAEGKFQSVGPSTVFIDATDTVRFVGLALTATTPTYGSRNQTRVDEHSQVAYQRFTGLIACDLMFANGPGSTDDGREYLERQDPGLSRPSGYIIARLLETSPERRYPQWKLAADDVEHAQRILQINETAPASDPASSSTLFDFAAYLDFRLTITRRNPTFRSGSLRDYVYAVVRRFLREITREADTAGLEQLTDPQGRHPKRIYPKSDQKHLLFLSKVLIGLAEGYSESVRLDANLRKLIHRDLTADILLSVVWLEAESMAKSLAVDHALRRPQPLQQLVDILRDTAFGFSEPDYTTTNLEVVGTGLPPVMLADVISRRDLQSLFDILQGLANNPQHDANRLNFLTAKQIAFAVLVLLGRVRLSNDSYDRQLGLGSTLESQRYNWIQTFRTLVGRLDPAVNPVGRDEIETVGNEMGRFFRLSSQLRPFQRKNAVVLQYGFLQREGSVRFRTGLRLRDAFFGHNAAGSEPWETYSASLIPCTVDVRRDRETGDYYPIKISLGPRQLMEARYSDWKSKVRRVFVRTQDGPTAWIRKRLFWPALAGVLVGVFAAYLWGWQYFLPPTLFFALERIYGWYEYLQFRGR